MRWGGDVGSGDGEEFAGGCEWGWVEDFGVGRPDGVFGGVVTEVDGSVDVERDYRWGLV